MRETANHFKTSTNYIFYFYFEMLNDIRLSISETYRTTILTPPHFAFKDKRSGMFQF